MTQPLDGARLKIIRAQEHLDSLKAEVRMYLDTQPQVIRSKPARSELGGRINSAPIQELETVVPGAPPVRLSAIIGDCVTNARAALDYIAWELAQKYFSPRLDVKKNPGDKKLASFPILQKPASLKKYLNDLKNRKMPTKVIKEIEASQPYNTGYESLLWLRELVNTDKHRMLLLTTGEFDYMTVTLATPAIYQDLIKQPVTLTIPRSRAAKEPPLQSDVQMKGEVSIYVTWADAALPREPVDKTLDDIVKCVATTTPKFDGCF